MMMSRSFFSLIKKRGSKSSCSPVGVTYRKCSVEYLVQKSLTYEDDSNIPTDRVAGSCSVKLSSFLGPARLCTKAEVRELCIKRQ